MATKDDDDYEHWPDNLKLQAVPATPAPRYDNHNGLYEHTYRPAGEVKVRKAEPEAPAPAPQQYVQYAPPYAQMGYGAYPAPGYYGYGGGYGGAAPPYAPAYAHYTTQPAPAVVEETPKTKKVTKAKFPRKWHGRTKAEVEEDDMKIAATEGAYAPRKVQPLDMADDQMVWVVELDGGSALRAFGEVKDLKGEWKADPRFKDSWYFVREAEEEAKK